MPNKTQINWFADGGKAYSAFRPTYPPELSLFLSQQVQAHNLAVDVGCGNGQLTTQLAQHFTSVIGVDPSQDQIANADQKPNVQYMSGPAEKLPLANASANLITAAQAAHWFNLPKFYSEVRRIAAPSAELALVSYGVFTLDEQVNQRVQDFYWKEIGKHWPAERKLVDNGYKDILFPFAELPVPKMHIEYHWDLAQLLGYISTWSAFKKAKEHNDEKILKAFACDLEKLWGDPKQQRSVRWPINVRLGKIS